MQKLVFVTGKSDTLGKVLVREAGFKCLNSTGSTKNCSMNLSLRERNTLISVGNRGGRNKEARSEEDAKVIL